MSLKEKFNALKEAASSRIPPETLEKMRKAQDDLDASGIMDRVLKVGDVAPEFELKNTSEQVIGLKNLLSESPLILNFYRGKW